MPAGKRTAGLKLRLSGLPAGRLQKEGAGGRCACWKSKSAWSLMSLSGGKPSVVLKKNELRPRMNEYWCIPPKENADFTAHMENILDVYEMPYNPQIPAVCMDEKPYQILDNRLEPLPMRCGDIQKTDSEYIRKGTCSIFIFAEPLTGWRYASVQERRTAEDRALEIKHLLTECYPCHEKIILVMDSLNTHALASLYKCFPAPEARSYAKRLEIHYTPKHGGWLNIAEIKLNAMTRQCLARRFMDLETVRKEVKMRVKQPGILRQMTRGISWLPCIQNFLLQGSKIPL